MILVISQMKKRANALSDILYYMGILSVGVTPKEAASEISPDYSAVILTNPELMPDVSDFVGRIRKYASDIPLIAVSDGVLPYPHSELFDLCLSEGIYSTTMVKAINEFCKEKGKRAIGSYYLAGIDAGCELKAPKYFDSEIPLTRTEAMILRYLIRIYPRKARAAEILSHAFKSGRCPEVASIRTHISVMNKKFRQLHGHSLISSFEGDGYTVMTPEYVEGKKEMTV